MHTVFALLCFVVVIHWLIFPYPSGLLHWHCGNLTFAPVPAKQPWWIWINTSCEFIMNDCITTTKQSTTKPCAYFLGYTVPETDNWFVENTWYNSSDKVYIMTNPFPNVGHLRQETSSLRWIQRTRGQWRGPFIISLLELENTSRNDLVPGNLRRIYELIVKRGWSVPV